MTYVPPKVIHVVQNLDRGAVENWLVRMLRFAVEHRVSVDWTFYCSLNRPGALDTEARALGARVVHSPVPIGESISFMRSLRHELRIRRYDVLHCHHDLVSAVYLVAAAGLPIRRRIVHVHNADRSVLTPNVLKQLLLRPLLRKICIMTSDRIVGISNHTLDTFLGSIARKPVRDLVVYYGVEQGRFVPDDSQRVRFRRELGFADDASIMLFAGRMVPEKGPLFAVDVLAEMRQIDAKVVGLFVGSGSLDAAVQQRGEELGLGCGIFRYLGWRKNIQEIMGCCDLFILPRPETPPEGFGLAVVEAQLAGLPMLLSLGIADDPLLPSARYRRVKLSEGARTWALVGVELLHTAAPSRETANQELGLSGMDMERAFGNLIALHDPINSSWVGAH